ncbi:MAG: hypothetical protein GWN01_01005 [Nitrosopumilaceae archaeon]|nr:hypothetical protein [Nitrosopumilaceae archaeon]NIX60158.1 hypothetical protein [Nitrosopumilaceae archaeon]
MSNAVYVSEAYLDIKIQALENMKEVSGLSLHDAENLCIYRQLQKERVNFKEALIQIEKLKKELVTLELKENNQ